MEKTQAEPTKASIETPQEVAIRGLEIKGMDIYKIMPQDTKLERALELTALMNADVPEGGIELKYGDEESHRVQYWSGRPGSPLILYVHGGSWQVGTHLDSIGSAKVGHLTAQGYAFATVDFSLIPKVTVKQQIQEIAKSMAYLTKQANTLKFDANRFVLMGHSSGGYNVTLLGTDQTYLEREGLSIDIVEAIISLDGSNYNCLAEIIDSPGPIATNMLRGIGSDPELLEAMSPVKHARRPTARTFLFLHVQRHGDIRQAMEFVNILRAIDVIADLHVFEGEFYEGHIQMLLRLGLDKYPATQVLDQWLAKHVPISK